jgi:ATP/maltotriose-dependent transcriptional regulator MalT
MDPTPTPGALVGRGEAHLAAGHWDDARSDFEAALSTDAAGGMDEVATARAWQGLAGARWWLGENQASVDACTSAYAGFRRAGAAGIEQAVQCAVWLAIVYKSNFANTAAANGWLSRADRLLGGSAEPGPGHAWVAIARAYRLPDLARAEALTAQALDLARAAGDVDLELVALAQLGHIRVAKGDTAAGFALIDEAMAGALGGERSSLDTVVYACCDMLNACDLATDVERAAQWCAVADDFVERYGCPFLYAECRTLYGSVLTATGRWDEAERQLTTAVRLTDGACPSLHARALVRLAELCLRQGRLEDVDQLMAQLDEHLDAEAESTLTRAALLLARGDAAAAAVVLAQRLDRLAEHRAHGAAALALLVDAHLAADDVSGASAHAARLTSLAATGDADRVAGLAAEAEGRIALASGDDLPTAFAALERARDVWSALDLPYETALSLVDLARAEATTRPDVAVEHGRRALATFEQLGARDQADRAAALLRSLGVTPRIGAKNVGTLTEREQEVLSLLGLGLTNPEIAGRLHVSRKTAAHHVSSVLSKLALRNRAEAAALVARLTR